MQLLRKLILGEPDGHLVERSVLCAGLSLVVTYPLIAIAEMSAAAIDWHPESVDYSQVSFAEAVFVAPILETLILTAVLTILSRFRLGIVPAASIAALFWGVVHASQDPLQFIAVLPGFFLDSCAYLVWQSRSYWHGFAAAAIQHMLNNMVVYLSWGMQGEA